MRNKIFNSIHDVVLNFTYYDRKGDEDLSREQLLEAVKTGKISIDEMVDAFRKNLETELTSHL